MTKRIAVGIASCVIALAARPTWSQDMMDPSGNEPGVPIEYGEPNPPGQNLPIPPPSPGCMDANLQILATASSSGGGATTFGPQLINDGIFGTGNSPSCCVSGGCWSWVTAGVYPTTSWYELDWTSPVSICQIWVDTKPIAAECGVGTNRALHAADVETWNGTVWQVRGSVTAQTDDWGFTIPGGCVTTTKLRLNRVGVWDAVTSQMSNPILYELKVYGCSGGPTVCRNATVSALNPTAGSVGANTCSVSQTFTADMTGFPDPGNITFTVTPPAGGTAAPLSNVVPFAQNSASATSTHLLSFPGLCGPKNFTVSATAVANCVPPVPSTSTITYQLTDATPPILISPPGVTLECGSFTGVPPPSQTGSPTVTDNCDANVMVSGFTDVQVAAPPPTPACPGNYNIIRSFNAMDCSGNVATGQQVIAVRDTQGPAMTQSKPNQCLRPVNGNGSSWLCLTTAEVVSLWGVQAGDSCSGQTQAQMTSCTSNQAHCGNFPPPDCYIQPTIPGGPIYVCMRAYNCGTGTREYRIGLSNSDGCGNPATGTVIMKVPQGNANGCLKPNRRL